MRFSAFSNIEMILWGKIFCDGNIRKTVGGLLTYEIRCQINKFK